MCKCPFLYRLDNNVQWWINRFSKNINHNKLAAFLNWNLNIPETSKLKIYLMLVQKYSETITEHIQTN